jgi:hypothetical protein
LHSNFANKANFTSCETKDKENIKPMLSSYLKFEIISEIGNCWSWLFQKTLKNWQFSQTTSNGLVILWSIN